MPTITSVQAGGIQVCNMLDLVAWSEGTSTSSLTKNNGYDVNVSSVDGPSIFDNYAFHPFEVKEPVTIRLVPLLKSTAAGRYQLLLRYWLAYKQQLGLKDFSPLSQDIVAIQQMKERRAIAPLLAGDIDTVIGLLSSVWASLPGNNYQQGGKTLQVLLNKWQEFSQNA